MTKTSILTYILLLLSSSLFSQDVLKSQRGSSNTYIYKISNAEAADIYEYDGYSMNKSYFHSLVDSIDREDEIHEKNLPTGHYLLTYAENNKQVVEYYAVENVDVFFFNNDTDLAVQVYNLKGEVIEDAKVKMNNKKLSFDTKTKTYLDKKSNREGLISVEYEGHISYTNTQKKYKNSAFNRGFRKVVYGTPLKYVYAPINYVISLPIDGYKSIKRSYATGSIYRTKHFAIKTFDDFRCLFDEFYCDGYYQEIKDKHNGYLVFNKPKYKPNDTVKFKAYIVNEKSGKPYSKDVDVFISRYSIEKKITTISPYNSGGYTYEFLLADSLEMKLDYYYNVVLKDKKGRTIISQSFSYEEYELGKTKLEISTDNDIHYKGEDLKLTIKATDENDLYLMDANAEVFLSFESIDTVYDDYTFVPNTLLTIKKDLATNGDTEIILSDSLFPKVEMNYKINVIMRTSDNEVSKEEKEISYKIKEEKIGFELQKDSLLIKYQLNGKDQSELGEVYGIDAFGNTTFIAESTLPYQLKINPYYDTYFVKVGDFYEDKKVDNLSSGIQVYTQRDQDSIKINVKNPSDIPFNYNFYQLNTEKEKGFTKTLAITREAKNHKNYYFTVNYVWGGEVKKETYLIGLNEEQLNIKVKTPKIVTPGATSTFEIEVTDYKNNPVEGVDITAYGITNKFEHVQKKPPLLKKKKRNKTLINSFDEGSMKNKVNKIDLNYTEWKTLASLDTIPYYNFLYPENGIFKTEISTEDSITQFIPYVVYKGKVQPIQVVSINDVPRYFGWTQRYQPAAIRTFPGKVSLKIRTTNAEIEIKDFEFQKGMKTIFSIDKEVQSNENISVKEMPFVITDHEINLWSKYTLVYSNNFKTIAFLENNDNYFLLNDKPKTHSYTSFVGPIYGKASLNVLESYDQSFNFEPSYKYFFSEKMMKMKDYTFGKKSFFTDNTSIDFDSEVLTEQKIKQQWKNFLEEERRKKAIYFNPKKTYEGRGELIAEIESKNKLEDLPLNTLLMKLDDGDFIRVYQGQNKRFHDLDSGYYQLIYFYSDKKYFVKDSVRVDINGTNYLKIEQPTKFSHDEFGKSVSDLIERSIYGNKKGFYDVIEDYQNIKNNYTKQFTYKGAGDIISGVVLENEELIPGVTVSVVGTNLGTITDLDGQFSLKIPEGKDLLKFSSIGYKEQIVAVEGNFIEVHLDQEHLKLEEVVVIGYAVQTKKALTASVSTVEVLKGRVAGVNVRGVPGASSNIVIRGNNSISSGESLVVINGKIYEGDMASIDKNLIQSMEVLKDASATAIYGSRGVNGVILINLSEKEVYKLGLKLGAQAEMNDSFLKQAKGKKSLRTNFDDAAFWEPSLTTNAEGKVIFEATFPDDITKWDTFFLAMNGKKQSGMTQESIKSYMPLAGQLSMPRFVNASDTVQSIGKALNYLGDSLQTKITYTLDGHNEWTKDITIKDVHIDTLTFSSNQDSLSIQYMVESESGFFDGEEKKLPVYPLGIELAKGTFDVLENDTSFNVSSSEGISQIYASANYQGILENEIEHVIGYRYLCNEQLASKLNAHLASYTISQKNGDKYKHENAIKKLIRKLDDSKNNNALWGW